MASSRLKQCIENEFSKNEVKNLDVYESNQEVIVSGTFYSRPISVRFRFDKSDLKQSADQIRIIGVDPSPGIYFSELEQIISKIQSAIMKY